MKMKAKASEALEADEKVTLGAALLLSLLLILLVVSVILSGCDDGPAAPGDPLNTPNAKFADQVGADPVNGENIRRMR